jgi:hypothetical protein
VVVIIVYTVGVLIEFSSGLEGAYLAINILFILTSFTAAVGVAYSHFKNNIKLNYWIMIMLIIRMCCGLIQPWFSGIVYNHNFDYSLVAGFNSYSVIEGLLFMIVNFSHKGKIIIVYLLHLLALGSLLLNIFLILGNLTFSSNGWCPPI